MVLYGAGEPCSSLTLLYGRCWCLPERVVLQVSQCEEVPQEVTAPKAQVRACLDAEIVLMSPK